MGQAARRQPPAGCDREQAATQRGEKAHTFRDNDITLHRSKGVPWLTSPGTACRLADWADWTCKATDGFLER